jgi:hypothetical protein
LVPPLEFEVPQLESENVDPHHQWAEARWGEMASITTAAKTNAPAFLINRRRDVVFWLLGAAFSLVKFSLFVSDIANTTFQAWIPHKATRRASCDPLRSQMRPIGVRPT